MIRGQFVFAEGFDGKTHIGKVTWDTGGGAIWVKHCKEDYSPVNYGESVYNQDQVTPITKEVADIMRSV